MDVEKFLEAEGLLGDKGCEEIGLRACLGEGLVGDKGWGKWV